MVELSPIVCVTEKSPFRVGLTTWSSVGDETTIVASGEVLPEMVIVFFEKISSSCGCKIESWEGVCGVGVAGDLSEIDCAFSGGSFFVSWYKKKTPPATRRPIIMATKDSIIRSDFIVF
ncbi:MAG: hypothetical protein QG600_754 [Patescibacteria group bacterium]|nr:hypothetical protein [Patescibacteria group bacterium]